MPLLDGLQFCFRMNETSGNRVDSVGGLQLAPTNITAGAGRFGNAVDLAGSSSWLQATGYNSAYRGVGSFTVAAWVNLDNLPPGGNGAYVVNRWFGGDPARDYILLVSSTGNVGFDVVDSAGTVRVAATNNTPITTSNWHLLIGWCDLSQGANGTIYVQVNNGTVFSLPMPAAKITTDTTSLLSIGSINIGLPSFGSTDGRIDQVCKWSRVLTADERGELWNSGVGKAFPFVVDLGGEIGWWCPSLDGAGNGTANLVDLSESGNRGTLTNMDPPTDWVGDTANGGVRALDFDGVNDYVSLGTNVPISGQLLTVSAWIRPTGSGECYALTQYRTNVSPQRNFYFGSTNWTAPGQSVIVAGTSTISFVAFTGPQLPLNTWTHVAAVLFINGASSVCTIYHNGQPVTTTNRSTGTSPSTFPTSTTIPFEIQRGIASNGTPFYGLGRVDDIRVFLRLLTQSEITALASYRGYQLSSNTRRRRYAGAYGL